MNFRRRSYLCVASVAIAAMVLVSCSKSDQTSTETAATGENAPAKSGGLASKVISSTKSITLPSGTSLSVVLDQGISSQNAKSGDQFSATVVEPVVVNGTTAIPKDSHVSGHVVDAQASGRLSSVAHLSLALDSVEVGGKSYDLQTSPITRSGSSHNKRNIEFIGGGTAVGALIGGLAGHGKGAAIGAAAGAAAGTGAAAATGKKDITVPAEAALHFKLTAPVTIVVKG